MSLPDLAERWATPTSSIAKGGVPQDSKGKRDLRLDISPSGPSAPEATGRECRPKLNPRFVEHLQGLPAGWTAFGALETPWSRWLRLMRSELSRLGWE